MHCRLILQFNDIHGHVIKTTVDSGHHLGNEISSSIEGWPYLRGCICTKGVHLGLSTVAYII